MENRSWNGAQADTWGQQVATWDQRLGRKTNAYNCRYIYERFVKCHSEVHELLSILLKLWSVMGFKFNNHIVNT